MEGAVEYLHVPCQLSTLIKAKVVCQLSMLLSKLHYRGKEARVLARERKDDSVNEKALH